MCATMPAVCRQVSVERLHRTPTQLQGLLRQLPLHVVHEQDRIPRRSARPQIRRKSTDDSRVSFSALQDYRFGTSQYAFCPLQSYKQVTPTKAISHGLPDIDHFLANLCFVYLNFKFFIFFIYLHVYITFYSIKMRANSIWYAL